MLATFGIGRRDWEREDLFEFKPALGLPPAVWFTGVVASFVAAVLLTHAEYRESGTVYGFGGAAFNVLFSPIYEELIFRGWILRRLARRQSAAIAIAISALLFGLLHLRLIYFLETDALIRTMAWNGLVYGPALGYLSLRLRTLWPGVILHYAINLSYYL